MRRWQIPKREQTYALEFCRAVVNVISLKTVAEIKSAINALSDKDAWTVAEWLRNYLETCDSKSGDTAFIFYGDPALLEEIEKSFVGQGLNAMHDVMIRASQPKPNDKPRAKSDMIRIVESVERIAIAYLAFLDNKNTKLKLRFKSVDESVEVKKGDAPEKISQFIQKRKSKFFNIGLTL